ncbi:MAG: aminotransferase class III-fold pyridoxal phosphate-dependent enzyme [Acidobacteria bacterium]|nr:aminotransferase class III-fold pyridoxal phosphate-dependent enzyme [Acidobacteriota bacterium]
MRRHGGAVRTVGLSDTTVADFLTHDDSLAVAIGRAVEQFDKLKIDHADLLALDEAAQCARVQDGFINFYPGDQVNPYVAIAGQGPWIVTLNGGVIYDCGGYGMLGFGHAPENVIDAISRPHVMANVMTPSLSHMNLVDRLRREIGHTRDGDHPFAKFVCLNSGSEIVNIATRLCDINAKLMTDPGGRYDGSPIRSASIAGGFHGRTDGPARFTDSTSKKYREHLASYRDIDPLLTVEPNDVDGLEAMFKEAENENQFIQAFLMEPVMGEGDPGKSITPEFYERVRELTSQHGALLLVDSIQAGFRAHGVLSIVDYPGFRHLPPPDMETYSKALNAGQFPLSVLAMSASTAALYQTGVYGNTMSSNPRAMDVAVAVLDSVTPELRENITRRGRELVDGLNRLGQELDDTIIKVQGTGLLLSCELHPRFVATGENSTEEYLRKNGLGVIHGGTNSLRYTPPFDIDNAGVDLILERTRNALTTGPVLS